MSAASRRAFFLLLAGLATAPPTGECAPYARPGPLVASVDLSESLSVVAPSAADTNLCEDMT